MIDKHIFIVRHGETEYNRMGMVQGCGVDSDLNETGQKQAKAFFDRYNLHPFDKIYTSRLKRTHQSVGHFIQKGIPWQQLEGLNEISWGNKEGRPITIHDDAQYKRMIEGWRNGELHLKEKGGESPLEVKNRQQEAFDVIMSQSHEKNVLICMHGRAMRILLCWLLDKPLHMMDDFQHNNLGLYVLDYSKRGFSLKASNDRSHLFLSNPH